MYADALTEKYRDRLYEAASEKDQANFSQAVADMRGEILVLQGAQSLADRPQIDEESIQSWKADGPIGSGLRASAESAPDSDTRQMQMQLLDKLDELADLQDGDTNGMRQMSDYAAAALALDVTLRTERDQDPFMTDLIANSNKQDHPLLQETITRNRFMEKVMQAKPDDDDDMKSINDLAWRAYGPMIERARREGAADVMIAAIQDAGRDAQYFRNMGLDNIDVPEQGRVSDLQAYEEMKESVASMEEGFNSLIERTQSQDVQKGGPYGGLNALGGRFIQDQLYREIRAAMEPAENYGDFQLSRQTSQAATLAAKIRNHQEANSPA